MRTRDLVTWVGDLGAGGMLVPETPMANDKLSMSTDKQHHAMILSLVNVPDVNGEPTMQKLISLEHTNFVERYENDAVAITVEPRLAHRVMRTKLVPVEYKKELLGSSDKSPADFIIRCARESELFYDIMLELGVLTVQEAA